MNEMIQILDNQIQVKEWAGQRVITFQDIDTVHQRPRGTASRNFRRTGTSLLEGTDYFKNLCRRNSSPQIYGDFQHDP